MPVESSRCQGRTTGIVASFNIAVAVDQGAIEVVDPRRRPEDDQDEARCEAGA